MVQGVVFAVLSILGAGLIFLVTNALTGGKVAEAFVLAFEVAFS